jgi:uncharacterized protein YndB with AHSA1/START domain
MAIRESATGGVDAPAVVVFGYLTDVSKLPNWNRAITDVVDTPRRLAPEAVWRVRI